MIGGIKIIITCSFIVVLSSCGNPEDNKQTKEAQEEAKQSEDLRKLEKRTMAIHDSIMPQMDSLMRLKQRLQSRLEAPESNNNIQGIEAQVDSLSAVRETMMDWMSRYSKNYKRIPDSAAISEKAEQLELLNQDIQALKKQWDQTLRNSVQLLRQEERQKPE